VPGPKQIQEMLGHSSIVVTMDVYGHLFDVLHEELADRHDAAIRLLLESKDGTHDL
jgi:integrase